MPKSALTDAHSTIAAYLGELRREKGVNQVELARRLKTTQQYVSKIETCERRLDLVQFEAYVRALGADPAGAAAEVFRRMAK